MATKPKKADKAESEYLARKNVQVAIHKDDSKEEAARKYADILMSPEFAAFRVMNSVDGKTNIFNDSDVPSLVDKLRDQAAAVNRGEMKHVEAMLMNQASALQSLFARMTERANEQTIMPNLEGFMRIALRAQNQCRMTLETLAAIKNPPVVYARQANIANGPQQVNNGTPAPARVREIETEQNKLLEAQHGNFLDTGATGEAVGDDSSLATVGTIHRAYVGER